MPRRQSVGTGSVVERSDECSEMVSGIVAMGSVPSTGPNDVVFEELLSDLHARDNVGDRRAAGGARYQERRRADGSRGCEVGQ